MLESANPESDAPNRTVVILGTVSLCTDLATQMVYPIVPIFLTASLGAPTWTVGIIEGLAESTASILKLYSGWLSDRLGQRKPLAAIGYGLGSVSKLVLALAGAWSYVLGARLIDRIGKGLRAAPRDALIIENSPADGRGRAFGLHHSLEAIGEVVGPLLGFLLLQTLAGSYRGVFAIAFLPAFVGVLLLVALVREAKPEEHLSHRPQPQFTLLGLSPTYRRYLVTVCLFGLGNSSDAFLLLRARDLGFPERQVLLLYALFKLVEVIFGYGAGSLSDRFGRRFLLVCGYLVFAGVYLGFAVTHSVAGMWLLFAVYGLYSTLTRGSQKAFVADLIHPERRGAEIGTFYMLTGLVALPASFVAGWLYTQVSAASPFYLSACTALLSALLLGAIGDPQKALAIEED